ncbi:hypothetical protein H4Q26_001474 [Puccinia striiformis f. sp. tritici PST-130]|nr:hypothetical protein H4Q26_001474 [Puccinia striiformis f. sp. tritici PST-130]
MSSFFQKTVIKPRKNLPEHTKQYQLKKYADATLGSGNLRSAVTLPEGEDLNEWLAVNSHSGFYNQINMLYGTVTEFCTPTECPVMSAGSRYEYHWHDGKEFRKATKVSAPEYVEYLMNWVQGFLDDEKIFPSKIGIEAHLNTSYRHFYFFIDEFELIKKDELIPLAELNTSIVNAELAAEDQKTRRLNNQEEVLGPMSRMNY